MVTTLAISLPSILQSIYAYAAADCLDHETEAVLSRDNEALLKRIARDIVAGTIFQLIPSVTGTNLTDSSQPDVITIDVDLPGNVPPVPLRVNLEVAVATGVLAALQLPSSELYHEMYKDSMKSLRRNLLFGSRPGYIKQHG